MTNRDQSLSGVLYGLAAYGSWGVFPLYFKTVADVPPVVVLAHRALWSFVVLAVLVVLLGRGREIWGRLHDRRLVGMLALSTLFIAVNWLTYIYAVISGHVLEASLGYFINPLVNVLLGVVLLRERLRTRQTLSIALGLAGVLVLAALVGQIPWLALALALTFSLYGLMRKIMPVDGFVSLTVETLVLAPLGLAYLGFLAATARHPAAPATLGLLILSGPITTVPLLLFGAAARRLRLSTMGILQYLSPTLQFVCAVAVFREPFSTAQLVSFACIWSAVLLYAVDSLQAARLAAVAVVEPD